MVISSTGKVIPISDKYLDYANKVLAYIKSSRNPCRDEYKS